jgi:hypothetical protein
MTDEKDQEFKETPNGQWKRWNQELTAAKKAFAKFHKDGDKVNKKFLDERTQEQDEWGELTTRLNLFHANITTLVSMLYGKIPKVEVARKFADADDDVARVAGLMLTRILNTDIEEAGEDAASVFRNGLQDRLIPGLGTARLQYQFSSSTQTVPAIYHEVTGQELAPEAEIENIDGEWTDIIYTHLKDVLWSPSRTHPEIRWKAYRSFLDKDEFGDRFPDIDATNIAFTSKGPITKSRGDKQDTVDPQVEVWEIWDKKNKCVYWWTDSHEEILDHQEDPLGLRGFWPEPPPFVANVTTSKYMPKSDYMIAQDLYRDIDKLQTRISLLTDACKLVGVYDKRNEAIKRIFTEGVENDLIPVDNWAMFAEKGGLKGTIDWVPIDSVVNAIEVLTSKQGEKIQQLYQVTGMNDIMRGAANAGTDRTSATRDQLEASYGSIRVEALQNEFARWVGDLQAIKVEIIGHHYQPENIIKQSNILATEDGQDMALVEQAVALIKNADDARWRITVRPETLAIADYAQLKQDRTEYINALALFMQSSAPLLEMDPGSLPELLKLLKWGLSGFRGSSEIEGVLDGAIARLEKQPPQPKKDPNAEANAAKVQQIQMEMQQSQQEHQQKMEFAQQDQQQKMQQTQQEFALKMQEMAQEFHQKMTETATEMVATIRKEAAQAQFNSLGKANEAAISLESGNEEHARDLELERLRQEGRQKPSAN